MPANFAFRTPNNRGFQVPAPGVLAGQSGVAVDAPAPTWALWPTPSTTTVQSVYFGADGVLWLAGASTLPEDNMGGSLWRGDALGVWQTIVPPGEFATVPYGARQHPNGDVYAVDWWTDRLYVWNCAANTWSSIAIPVADPHALAIDRQGLIWVVCQGADQSPLLSYNISTKAWETHTLPFPSVAGLAISQAGELIAVGKWSGIWLRGDKDVWRKVSEFWGKTATAPDGSLWVLDAPMHHIVASVDHPIDIPPDMDGGNDITVSPQGAPWVATWGGLRAYTSVTKTKLGRIFWGANGGFTYLPDPGATGVDTLTVPLKATTPGATVPTLTLEITVEQTAVSAEPSQLVTPVDTPMIVSLPADNRASGPVTYTITTPPTHGTLSVPNTVPNYRNRIQVYTPKAGWTGSDTFQFTATAGSNTSAPATVTIQVVKGAPTMSWVTPQAQSVLVNPPGLLVGTTGATVRLPARTWRKDQADGTEVQGVGLDPSTQDLWMTGIKAKKAYVWRRGPDGTKHAFGDTPDLTLQDPRGVIVTSDSTVWVADHGAKALWSRSGSTGAWTKVALTDAPWGLALDAQGRLHVSFPALPAGTAIRRYDPATSTWTPVFTGAGSPTTPKGIAFDAQGRIWAADADSNLVRRSSGTNWESIGAASTSAAKGAGTLNNPQGIAVDATGTVWVADTSNGRIQTLNPTTHTWTIINTTGGGEGELLKPTAVVVDPHGDAWAGDAQSLGLHLYAPFVEGKLGVAALRADGGMFYRPGRLTGYDSFTIQFDATGTPPPNRTLSFVVTGP